MKTYTVNEFARLIGRSSAAVSKHLKAGHLAIAPREEFENRVKIYDTPENRAYFSGKPGPAIGTKYKPRKKTSE